MTAARLMRYVGIDPGKFGGIALLEAEGGVVDRFPMPVIKAAGGGKSEYDLATIRDLLLLWMRETELFVTVEKTAPLPPGLKFGGGNTNFHRGEGRGWAWMLTALKVAHQLVAPQRWQADMHNGVPGGDTKARSILAVHRLFPTVSLARTARCTTDSDGIAEALLIAEWGRREHRGQHVAREKAPKKRGAKAAGEAVPTSGSILDPEPAT